MTESTQQSNEIGKTIWYLGYGANMNPKCLSDTRKVYPSKSIPCTVPNYELCFTVPGFPYMEPAFASVKRSCEKENGDSSAKMTLHGVVHEVTKDDFVQIQRTEGGGGHEGMGYIVEVLKCHMYSGEIVEAVTLVYDAKLERENIHPSKRYSDLLIDGAKHHGVDEKYIRWLENQPYYSPTTDIGRRVGRKLFIFSLTPVYLMVRATLTLNDQLRNGAPRFFFIGLNYSIAFSWKMHDYIFAKIFGSGARNN